MQYNLVENVQISRDDKTSYSVVTQGRKELM